MTNNRHKNAFKTLKNEIDKVTEDLKCRKVYVYSVNVMGGKKCLVSEKREGILGNETKQIHTSTILCRKGKGK